MKNRLIAGTCILLAFIVIYTSFSYTQERQPEGLTAFADIEAPAIPRSATYQKGDEAVSRFDFEQRMLINPGLGCYSA